MEQTENLHLLQIGTKINIGQISEACAVNTVILWIRPINQLVTRMRRWEADFYGTYTSSHSMGCQKCPKMCQALTVLSWTSIASTVNESFHHFRILTFLLAD